MAHRLIMQQLDNTRLHEIAQSITDELQQSNTLQQDGGDGEGATMHDTPSPRPIEQIDADALVSSQERARLKELADALHQSQMEFVREIEEHLERNPIQAPKPEPVTPELSMWQKIRVVSAFFNLPFIKGLIMKDWKTTITGVVKALIIVVGVFNIKVPDAVQQNVVELIGIGYALFEAIQGWVAKDKTPTASN